MPSHSKLSSTLDDLRPSARPLVRNTSSSNLPRGRPHVKSFSAHKVTGEWNTKTRDFQLSLPRGTVDVQVQINSCDGVYSLKFDEYNNMTEFIPWSDLDYPNWTFPWRLQKKLRKHQRKTPTPVNYPYPRCKDTSSYYNPARPQNYTQGKSQYFPDGDHPHFMDTCRPCTSEDSSDLLPPPSPSSYQWRSVSLSPHPGPTSPRHRSLSPSLLQDCPRRLSSPSPVRHSPHLPPAESEVPSEPAQPKVSPPIPVVCVNCHQTGHTYWECGYLTPGPVCYNCEERGHTWQQCPFQQNNFKIYKCPSPQCGRPNCFKKVKTLPHRAPFIARPSSPQPQIAIPPGNPHPSEDIPADTIPQVDGPADVPPPSVIPPPVTPAPAQQEDDDDCIITNYEPPPQQGYMTVPIANTRQLKATIPTAILQKIRNKSAHLKPTVLVYRLKNC